MVVAVAPLLISGFIPHVVHAQGHLEQLGDRYLNRTATFGGSTWNQVSGQQDLILQGASWSPESMLWIGEETIAMKQYGIARYMLSTLVDEYPNTSSATLALLNQGLIAIENRAYGKARIYFDETIIKGSADGTPEGEQIAGTALYLIAYTHAVEGEHPIETTVALLKEFLDHYPGNPREADARYTLGEIAEIKGNYEEAIGYYTLITRSGLPRLRLEARNHHAQCLARLGRYQEAQEELIIVERDLYNGDGVYRDAAAIGEIYADCMLLRGEIEIALGNHLAAEQAFVNLMNSGQLYKRKGLLGLADTYQAAGRNDSAFAIYSRLIVEDSTDLVYQKAQFNQAMVLRTMGREEEASTVFEAISRDTLHVMNDGALVELALIRYGNKEYHGASEALHRVIAHARDLRMRIRAYTIKGAVELGWGEPSLAIESFDAAEKLSARVKDYQGAELAEARLLNGITLASTRRSAEAITTLNRFLESYPGHAGRDEALYWLGESYYQSGLYRASVDVMEDLIEEFPSSIRVPDAMYTTGWSQFREQRFDKADAAFSQLVKAFPTSRYTAEAQLRRGDAFYLSKRYDEAAQAYKQVEKLNPTPEEASHAAYQGALAHMQAGRFDVADTLLQSVADCYTAVGHAEDALYRRGEIAIRQGDAKKAIGVLTTLLGRGTREDLLPMAYAALGDAHRAAGNLGLAAGAYSIGLQRFPKSSLAGKLQKGIAEVLREQDESRYEGCDQGDRFLGMGRAGLYLELHRAPEALREFQGLNNDVGEGACQQQVWLGIARSHMAMGESGAAMDTLRLVISRYPYGTAVPAALYMLGETSLARKDTNAAVGYFEQVRGAYADSAESIQARLRLADIYSGLGQPDSARALLYENVGHFPANTVASWSWLRLAWIDQASDRRDTILANLHVLAGRKDTLGAEALLLLAQMESDKGRTGESIGMLEQVTARFKGESRVMSRALFAIGNVYQRMGEPAKAKSAYEMILQRYCDETLRKQAEENIQALSKL